MGVVLEDFLILIHERVRVLLCTQPFSSATVLLFRHTVLLFSFGPVASKVTILIARQIKDLLFVFFFLRLPYFAVPTTKGCEKHLLNP